MHNFPILRKPGEQLRLAFRYFDFELTLKDFHYLAEMPNLEVHGVWIVDRHISHLFDAIKKFCPHLSTLAISLKPENLHGRVELFREMPSSVQTLFLHVDVACMRQPEQVELYFRTGVRRHLPQECQLMFFRISPLDYHRNRPFNGRLDLASLEYDRSDFDCIV